MDKFTNRDLVEELPRYFKHSVNKGKYFLYEFRFKNKTEFIIGIIMETQFLKPTVTLYHGMKEYVERVFNVNVIFDWVPFDNIVSFNCSSNMSSEGNLLDFLFVPFDGLTLYGCDEAFPTSIFSFSETVIVTSEPPLNIIPSLNLFKMERMVAGLFVVSCCLITLLLTVSIRLSVSRPSRSFLMDLMINFWDTLFTFFYEPYPNLTSVASARIACVSWLIGVLVIYIDLSSSLKSEFSIKTYETIDSMKCLADHSDVKPFVMRNAMVFRYISFMKNQNLHMKKLYEEIWANRLFFDLLDDMIQEDFNFILADKRDKKALVIHREYLNRVLGFDLQSIKERECLGNEDEPCSLNNLPLVQIGADDEKMDPMSLIMSKHLYQSQHFREVVNLAVLVLFETQCDDFYDFETVFNLEFVTWKPPAEAFNAQKLSDARGIFFLFFYMSMASILVFLLEIISGSLQHYYRSSRKTRRRNHWNSIREKNIFFFDQY